MSTILPEEPIVPDRESVILSNAERRYLRRKLKDSLAVTRDVLNPRNQLRRLVERQTTQAKQIADETVQVAKKNAGKFLHQKNTFHFSWGPALGS